ncbi:hypothetical protein GCM10027589_03840 [Actinocorallia lasiicapitis]
MRLTIAILALALPLSLAGCGDDEPPAAVPPPVSATAGNGANDAASDPGAIAVKCLAEAGLVPATYTAGSFRTDLADGFKKAPFKITDAKAVACFDSAQIPVPDPQSTGKVSTDAPDNDSIGSG